MPRRHLGSCRFLWFSDVISLLSIVDDGYRLTIRGHVGKILTPAGRCTVRSMMPTSTATSGKGTSSFKSVMSFRRGGTVKIPRVLVMNINSRVMILSPPAVTAYTARVGNVR